MLVSAASRRVPVPFEQYWDPQNCAKNFSPCMFLCKNVMTQFTFYYMEYSKDTSETKKNLFKKHNYPSLMASTTEHFETFSLHHGMDSDVVKTSIH